jgi:hypothetical protein
VQGYGVYLASFFSSVVCFFRQLQPTITTPKISVSSNSLLFQHFTLLGLFLLY